MVFGYPAERESSLKVNDLDTAETFWDLSSTGGRGYSGWGTGMQPSYGYGGYGAAYPSAYYSDNSAYGNYAPYGYYGNYGNYGSHGNYGGYPSNYGTFVKKIPVFAGYSTQQPTYENYGLHGGHGFGKYGKY